MQDEFVEEVKLLRRVIYKNKNQHRRLRYFQHLQMAVRKLRALQIAASAARALQTECTLMLNNAKTGSDINAQVFEQCLCAQVNAANLSLDASRYCLYAANHLSALVAKGWFLTFAVVSLASISRAQSFCQGSGEFVSAFQQFATMGLRRLRIVCLQTTTNAMGERNALAVQFTRIVLNARGKLRMDVTSLNLDEKRIAPRRGRDAEAEEEDLGSSIKRSKIAA